MVCLQVALICTLPPKELIQTTGFIEGKWPHRHHSSMKQSHINSAIILRRTFVSARCRHMCFGSGWRDRTFEESNPLDVGRVSAEGRSESWSWRAAASGRKRREQKRSASKQKNGGWNEAAPSTRAGERMSWR